MASLVELFFQQEGIRYEIVTDLALLMTACKGHRNPVGLVGYRVGGCSDIPPVILFDVYEAVKFVELYGLKQC